MLHKTLLLALSLVFGLNLQAQEEDPIFLVSAIGKIKYAPTVGAKLKKIKSGTALAIDGTLRIYKKQGVANLYCNGKFEKLQGKGTYVLKDIFGEQQGINLGLAGDFGNLLASAGGSKGGGPGGTGDGYGKKGDKIYPIQPFGGKVTGPAINFSWSKLKGEKSYLFELFDANGQKIHEAKVNGNNLPLNVEILKLEVGSDYDWWVKPASNIENKSKRITFTVAATEAKEKASQRAKKSKAFKSGDLVQQVLLQAVAFDKAELYYEADATFKKLLKLKPKNVMAKKMYAAFLHKYGFSPLAEQYYKKK